MPKLKEIMSALVWALATSLATFFISLPSAALWAGLGGFLGYLLGVWLSHSPLRLSAVGLLALLLHFSLWLTSDLIASQSWLASTLGAAQAFTLGQWINWGGKALCLTLLLRFLSGRFPYLITAEILSVTLLLASPLAAHRNGFINRPQFLVDPLWSQNLDPIPLLLGLGALIAAFLVILQNGRRTRRSTWMDLGLLLALITVLYALVPERRLLDWDLQDPLGLGQGKKKGQGGKGGQEKPEPGRPQEQPGGQGKSEAEEMELDKPQEKPNKPENVALVLLRDDYDPPYGFFFFRQTAFSQFNGKRLVADTTGKTDRDLLAGYPTRPTNIESSVPLDSPYHRKLGTFVALMKSHTRPFLMVDGRSGEPAQNPNPSQFVRAYECQSLVLNCKFDQLLGLKSGDPSWDPKVWQHYTQLPSNPKYQKLAQECVNKLPPEYQQSAFARALACKLWMDQNVTYTTKAHHDGHADPVAHYLFEERRGYCVHQAHAAVYLWRSLGLPSRVGAGYATDARNRGNGSAILLRSAEAHAWPEVYLQGAGWVVLDISPEKHEGGELEQPDPNLQRMLGEMARKERPAQEQDRFEKLDLQALLRSLLQAGWGLLRGFVGVLLLGTYCYKFYRRFEPLWCSGKRLPIAALRSALDQLAEVGLVRSHGEDRLTFARRTQLEALEPLTYWHLAAQLGGPTQQAQSRELLQLRERLHQQLTRRISWGRRLLGFLNPLSWWNSR